MYTLPKDTKITNSILNDVIQYNERYKDRFKMLEDYYLGKHNAQSSDWSQTTTVTTLTGTHEDLDNASYQERYRNYGDTFTLYDDRNEQSVPFWRIDDVELHFYTDNAYPSDSVPADVYTGSLVMELTTY